MHYDVVFHVDQDVAALTMALTNIDNYFAGLPGETFTVVLLVNGPAVRLMVRLNQGNSRVRLSFFPTSTVVSLPSKR